MKQAITTLFAFGVVAEASFMSAATPKLTQVAETTTEADDALALEIEEATIEAIEEVVAVEDEVDELRETRIQIEAAERTNTINFWITFAFLCGMPFVPLGTSILLYPFYAVMWIATILTKTAFSGRVYDNAAVRVDEEYYSGAVEL